MTIIKARNKRKDSPIVDSASAYKYLASVIIEYSIDTIRGGIKESVCQRDIDDSIEFLQSDKCRRWVEYLGVDYDVAIEHLQNTGVL